MSNISIRMALESGSKINTARFAVLSDIHLALTHQDYNAALLSKSEIILQTAIQDINAHDNLDFVIINGDLVNVPTAYDTQRAHDILEDLHAPYYIILGNHDVPQPPGVSSNQSIEPSLTKADLVQLFSGHGFCRDGKYWWSANPTDWLHLVGMDSNFVGDWSGYVPQKEIQWLCNDLDDHKDAMTIVFIHHGLVRYWEERKADPRYYVQNDAEVRAILESFNTVKILINGHLHLSGYKVQNGIHYFSVPALVYYPCAYCIFTVSPHSVDYELLQIPHQEILKEARERMYAYLENTKHVAKDSLHEQAMGMQKISVPIPTCD